jgi:hypothetical protein
MASLPAVQTSCLPVFRHETHSKMHPNHCYGPQTAVSSKLRCFHQQTRCCVINMLIWRRRKAVRVKRSTTNIGPKMNTKSSFTRPQDPRTFTGLVWPCSHHPRERNRAKTARLSENVRTRNVQNVQMQNIRNIRRRTFVER